MRTPKDATLKLEGERHKSGIRMDNTFVEVSLKRHVIIPIHKVNILNRALEEIFSP